MRNWRALFYILATLVLAANLHAQTKVIQGPQGPRGFQGIRGPAGPPGPAGAAGQGVQYRGTWVSAATYLKNDIVLYNGSSFIALVAHTGISTAPPLDGARWGTLAASLVGPTGAGVDQLTTKGDLLGYNGTSAARLGVGSNGTCLKADSTAPLGVAWQQCFDASTYALKSDIPSLAPYALKTDLNSYALTSALSSYALTSSLSSYALANALPSSMTCGAQQVLGSYDASTHAFTCAAGGGTPSVQSVIVLGNVAGRVANAGAVIFSYPVPTATTVPIGCTDGTNTTTLTLGTKSTSSTLKFNILKNGTFLIGTFALDTTNSSFTANCPAPDALTPVITDDFERANSSTTLGTNWTVDTATWGINGGAAYNVNGANGQVWWSGAGTLSNDQYVKVTLTMNDYSYGQTGPMARVQANGAGYAFYQAAGGYADAVIWKCDQFATCTQISYSSNSTGLCSTHAQTANDVYDLRAIGTKLYGYVNGTLCASVTDSTYASGKAGMRLGGNAYNSERIGYFEAGNVTTGTSGTTLVYGDTLTVVAPATDTGVGDTKVRFLVQQTTPVSSETVTVQPNNFTFTTTNSGAQDVTELKNGARPQEFRVWESTQNANAYFYISNLNNGYTYMYNGTSYTGSSKYFQIRSSGALELSSGGQINISATSVVPMNGDSFSFGASNAYWLHMYTNYLWLKGQQAASPGTCDSTNFNKIVHNWNTGVAGSVAICTKKSDGTYAWAYLSTSPSVATGGQWIPPCYVNHKGEQADGTIGQSELEFYQCKNNTGVPMKITKITCVADVAGSSGHFLAYVNWGTGADGNFLTDDGTTYSCGTQSAPKDVPFNATFVMQNGAEINYQKLGTCSSNCAKKVTFIIERAFVN